MVQIVQSYRYVKHSQKSILNLFEKGKFVPDRASRPPGPGQSRSEGKTPYVTSAVGLQEPEGRQRARRSTLFTSTLVWVTALVCLAFLLGALTQAWSNNRLMQDLQQARQKNQQLQKEHNDLVQKARYYQDPYVIEEEARQQLGYARPNEHVVVVVGANNQGSPPASSSTNAPPAQGFWQAWWNLFFGAG